MAWRAKTVALHCLMLVIVVTFCSAVRQEDSDQEVESVADIVLPAFSNILKQNPGAVACLLLQNPPKRCFKESRNKKRAEADREYEKSPDEIQDDCPPGQNCPSAGLLGEHQFLESSVSGDVNELRIGPKRFYNNW